MSGKRPLSTSPDGAPRRKRQKTVLSSEEEDEEGSRSSEMEEEPGTPSQRSEERGGTIKEVILENFMCHKHLKTVLGPKINFLTGPNGSGKSAVLVAIAVGLGAKTSFTNRGKRLDSIISNEEAFTRINITVWNGDRDPFKYDQYGDTITVERYIKRGGGGSYKVKNSQGKTIVTTRAEVLLLIEHYNILVNNPCAILMQDTSKEYLAKSTPKSKYTFYLKATQLEKILTDYQIIESQVQIMQNLLRKKKETLNLMGKSVQDLDSEYEDLQKLRTLESDIAKLKDTLMWSLIDEKEMKKESLEEKTKKLLSEQEKAAQSLNKIQTSKDQAEQSYETFNSEFTEARDKFAVLTAEQSAGGPSRRSEESREYRATKASIKDLTENKKNTQTRRDTLRAKIESVQQEALHDSAVEEKEIGARLSAAQTERQQIEEQKKELQGIINQKLEQKKQADRELYEFKHAVSEKKAEREKKKKTLEQLHLQKQNRVCVFGNNMPHLMKLIDQNERKFRKRPIGPIGLEVTLREASWSTAVNAAVGGLLGSFIVDNHENDEKLLKQLCQRCNMGQVSMIVQKHENSAYQIDPAQLPPRDIVTISTVLECNSPMVFNILIDQANFHVIALATKRTEAEGIIGDHNVRMITTTYLPDGSKVFTQNGSTNFVAARGNSRNYLGQDAEQLIIKTKKEMGIIEEEVHHMQKTWDNKHRETNALARDLKKDQGNIQSLSRKGREIDTLIEEIKHELKSKVEPVDVTEMVLNVEKLEEKLQEMSAQLEENKKNLPLLRKKAEAIFEEQKEKDDKLEKLSAIMEESATRVRGIQERVNKCESLNRRYTEKVVKIEEALRNAKSQQTELETELAQEIEKLQKNGIRSREEIGEISATPAQIDKQITLLETRLNTQLSAGGRKSIDDVLRELVEARKKYRATTQQYADLEEFSGHVKNELRTRLSDWKKIRTLTAKQIRSRFTGFLSQKGYAGSINFDHKLKTLNITVQLEKFREAAKSHSQTVNSLSGGERSFSTVSLLMALWATMETPFTAMDEFDVFMDQISRMKSTEMLLSFARGCSNRQQFIFITPQSLQNVKPAPDLHVINMFPPR